MLLKRVQSKHILRSIRTQGYSFMLCIYIVVLAVWSVSKLSRFRVASRGERISDDKTMTEMCHETIHEWIVEGIKKTMHKYMAESGCLTFTHTHIHTYTHVKRNGNENWGRFGLAGSTRNAVLCVRIRMWYTHMRHYYHNIQSICGLLLCVWAHIYENIIISMIIMMIIAMYSMNTSIQCTYASTYLAHLATK